MRVLIVGCGYVGLPLGERLVREGHEVHGLRRNPAAGPLLRAAGLQPHFADLTRPGALAALPEGFDWVVHCVAAGGVMDRYQSIYYDGTCRLLEWLARQPPRKLVYTSSTSVYGQQDGSVVTEASPAEPETAPARVLAATEALLRQAARPGPARIPAVILRLAGIYGPGRGHGFKMFLRGLARIEGDGTRVMNMIHRDDAGRCILAALQQGQPGETYNVVDDEPVTQRQFYTWLAATLGRPLPPAASEPGRRRRGVTNKRVSNARLRAELNPALQHPDFRSGYTAEIARLQALGEL